MSVDSELPYEVVVVQETELIHSSDTEVEVLTDSVLEVVVDSADPHEVITLTDQELLLETQTVTEVVTSEGRQGPPGVSALRSPITFSYGDTTPRLVYTLDWNGFLSDMQLSIETPFNGDNPSILVRTGTGQILMDTDQNSPGLAATYETTPAVLLVVGTQLYIEIVPGEGATAGSGRLLLNLY